MKRIVALVLAVIMIFALVACDKEKAEKYCWSCGEGITKSAVFCEHCGAKINESSGDNATTTSTTNNNSEDGQITTTKVDETTKQNTTSATTTTSKGTTSTTTVQTTTTSKSTTTSNVTTTTTKPTTTTTTKKTTTTTKKPTTTVHTHSYYKYVCTGCGAVDKTHAYGYLMEWVKDNGRSDGKNIVYTIQNRSGQKITLSYSPEYNNLFVDCYMNPGTSTEAYSMLLLDNYFYGFSFYGDTMYGYVNAASYSQSKSLTYSSADLKTYTPDQMLALAKSSVDVLIVSLQNCLLTNQLPITLADLGFKSF